MIEKRYKFTKQTVSAMLLLIVLLLMPVHADAQEIFAELAGMNHVESTYVSGRFSHNRRYWTNTSGTRYMDLSKGFSSLYSYQCYSEETVAKAREVLQKYLKKNPDIEVMMKTTQGAQEYVVYEKFIDDGKKVTQMIIWNSDAPNVCEVVVINWNKGLDRETSYYYDEDDLKSLTTRIERSFENLDLEKFSEYKFNVIPF